MERRSIRLLPACLRTGALGAAAILVAWAGTGPATARAGEAVTIPLDPGYVELSFSPESNVGALPVAIPLAESTFRDVEVGYGGTVTLTVPPQKVPAGPVGASLTLETTDGTHTGSYSTDPAAPAQNRLTLTDLGNNRYRIRLPADDGVDGPIGRLSLHGFALRAGLDVQRLDEVSFVVLRLSAGGPSAVEVAQEAHAMSCPPGREDSAGCAPAPSLAAGAALRVTLPGDSRFRALGLSGLRDSAFALQPIDPQSWPSRIPGRTMAATVSADGATATMTVPADLAAGRYQFTAVVRDEAARLVTITAMSADVVAAAPSSAAASSAAPSSAAPAGQVPAATDGTSGPDRTGLVVGLGSIALLLAGGGGLALMQHRHRQRHRAA